ncbi:MAG TPA: ATP-dependent sacrificial sulfur transferase LarE [Actinomycetota bacterium]|nr:ATP-dependent sacrificial sulfur transferase LarE [Actinomycetota bacterium]
METRLARKEAAVRASVRALGRVVVAFSGGVDSATLAALAHDELGADALAVTAASPSLSARELRGARALASSRGWNHVLVRTGEMERDEYARNEPDRCYWCKTELFEVLAPLARARDATVLVGTNADDRGDFRPGQAAGREHGARTPLADAGLTKADVRALARRLGLDVADKPASPCLASRIAYGVRVTPERLRRVERAEEAVRSLGFEILRVRDHGELARIEVPPADIARAASAYARLSDALLALGFRYVTLDLAGFRSGSMNEVLPGPVLRASGPDQGVEIGAP